MDRKTQRRYLALGGVALIAFIVGMVALALTLNNVRVAPKPIPSAGAVNGPVGTFHSGSLDKSGRYNGLYMSFTPPATAGKLQAGSTAADTEEARFSVGYLNADISTQAALPGMSLAQIALAYGPATPVTLSTGPGYIVKAKSGSTQTVVLLGYRDGRFSTISVSGSGDATGLAYQLSRSLTLAPRQSLLLRGKTAVGSHP